MILKMRCSAARRLLLLSMVAWLAIASGCTNANDQRFALSGNEKRYELAAKVVSVDRINQTLTVAHEEIKDFMPAMTMPFTLRDQWAYEILTPGDQITATLIVDGPRSWLQDIVITRESSNSAGTDNSTGVSEAKTGDEVPDYRLVNQNGKRISIHNFRGKALVLTFIYTRCPIPDYCTLMSTNFAKVEAELEKTPDLFEKTHLLSITIDPEYDTPQVLRSYGAAHTGKYAEETFAHWEFAGGSKDEVKGIAQYFGLRYYQATDEIIHGLRTVIVGPDGKVLKIYRGNEWRAEEVLTDLEALFKGDATEAAHSH